jgi:hypothetical protein
MSTKPKCCGQPMVVIPRPSWDTETALPIIRCHVCGFWDAWDDDNPEVRA